MILKIIYYLPFIIFIIYELYVLTNTKEYKEFRDLLVKTAKINKDKEKTEKIKYTPSENLYSNFMFLYVSWILIGLFTAQWQFILIILIMSSLPKTNYYLLKIDSFITISLLIFIIINAFHLHLNLF